MVFVILIFLDFWHLINVPTASLYILNWKYRAIEWKRSQVNKISNIRNTLKTQKCANKFKLNIRYSFCPYWYKNISNRVLVKIVDGKNKISLQYRTQFRRCTSAIYGDIILVLQRKNHSAAVLKYMFNKSISSWTGEIQFIVISHKKRNL